MVPGFPPDRREPGTFRDALAELVDREALRSREVQRRQWKLDRVGLHPNVDEFQFRFLRKAARAGIPLCAVRIVDDFDDPFLHGREAWRYGFALQVLHCVKGYGLSRKAWSILGHIGTELSNQRGLGIVWGGEAAPYYWEFGRRDE